MNSCLHSLNSDEGYYNAKKALLKKRFGDPHKIAQAIQKQAYEWSEIKEDDADGLNKFMMFLTEAQSTMSSVHALN